MISKYDRLNGEWRGGPKCRPLFATFQAWINGSQIIPNFSELTEHYRRFVLFLVLICETPTLDVSEGRYRLKENVLCIR